MDSGTFVLFRNNRWHKLNTGSTSLPRTHWKNEVPLKVLLHGFSEEQMKSASGIIAGQKISKIGSAYGKMRRELNVMIVDWTSMAVAQEAEYQLVVDNVPVVAQVIAEYLTKLVKAKHLVVGQIHLIGYGVGAHVAGVTGKKMNNMVKTSQRKIARITGLDPARVGFDDECSNEPNNKSLTLWKHDAEYVDV